MEHNLFFLDFPTAGNTPRVIVFGANSQQITLTLFSNIATDMKLDTKYFTVWVECYTG